MSATLESTRAAHAQPPSPRHRWDPQAVRFLEDEPARHNLLQLLGALALLGEGGNSGWPLGHIVAQSADASLLLEFCKALVEACM